MGKLKERIKRVSLAFMGEGWEEAYLDFTALKWRDIRDMDDPQGDANQSYDLALAVLRRKFVGGQGIDPEGQPVALTAEDLDEFDIETQGQITAQLGGGPSPNA